MNPQLLAIDTATSYCSVALTSKEGVIRQRITHEPRAHAHQLLPMVDDLLAQAGILRDALDGIVFSAGPGSFTGIRIGLGVAQGLAFGLDCPIYGVSTLQAMAEQAHAQLDVIRTLVLLDARMNEVYWGAYVWSAESGLMQPVAPDAVGAPETVTLPDTNDWMGVGEGLGAYDTILSSLPLKSRHKDYQSEARYLLPAAIKAWHEKRFVAAEQAEPQYCRSPSYN